MKSKKQKVHHAYAESPRCRWFAERGHGSKRVEEVTCGCCLKRIRKLGLKNREDFPAMPTFEVTFCDDWVWAGVKRQSVTFRCPVCGVDIRHGWSEDSNPDGESRSPHCGCWDQDYIIKLAKHENQPNKQKA